MNATKTALIAGAGVLGLAAAGLGWRCLKARKASQPVAEVKPAQPVVPPVTRQQESVVVKELTPQSLREAGNPVLSAIADMEDNNWNLGTESRVIAPAEVDFVEENQDINDKVEEIKDGSGKPILSISRPRCPATGVVRTMDSDMSPIFWKNFLANIKRPDVIELSSQKDFVAHSAELAKGFHKCTLDGVTGVLHVTKSHSTAIIHLGGTEFSGISTSVSRFNGKGLQNLTAEQAKNFLAGR